jgi:hypothetical protein
MSKKAYEPGRKVAGLYDFTSLCNEGRLFIKNQHQFDPTYYDRHPRALQAQTAGFMKVQQFWVILLLIERGELYVAEKIKES